MANPLRKTMVYLGLADEEIVPENDSSSTEVHDEPAAKNQASRPAAVTPIRKNTTVKNVGPQEMNEILTVHPKQYKDAQLIAENFRNGVPVIINLSQMTETDARRLVDFASGLSQGLLGKIERVTAKVFLLSPQYITVSGDSSEEPAQVEASFFAK